MNLIFIGPPGAGKGTQAKNLIKKFNIPQISTGEMFRSAVKNGTEMGLKAKPYMDKGELVPFEIVLGIVGERLGAEDCNGGFLLDGFPRTIEQADALGDILTKLDKKLDHVVALDVADDELMKRLTGRRVCKACGAEFHVMFKPTKTENMCDLCGGEVYQRSDDNEDSIKQRLTDYHSKTKPLIDYYQERGFLRKIDGIGGFDEVFARIENALS